MILLSLLGYESIDPSSRVASTQLPGDRFKVSSGGDRKSGRRGHTDDSHRGMIPINTPQSLVE